MSLEKQGLSEEVVDFVINGWSEGTKRQYTTPIQEFVGYCSERCLDPFSATVNDVAEYLVKSFKSSSNGYSALGTRRSAISAFLPPLNGLPIGNHPIIKKVMKGIFKLRPAIPRYTETYDINQVLNYLKTLGDNNNISIKDLTYRLSTLLCILSGQRGQTLASINTDFISIKDDTCIIIIPDIMKTTKPGFHVAPLKFLKFPLEPRLCMVENLERYLEKTSIYRGKHKQLLLSHAIPHNPVKVSTIRRWVTDVLQQAGINIKIFTAHSTRVSSTSKAKQKGVSMDEICRAGGWKNCQVFAKHYDKCIIEENFANELLKP